MQLCCLSFLFFSTKIITNLLYSNNGDNMRKKFKRKKRFNTKLIFMPLILIALVLLYVYLNINVNIHISNKNFLNIFLKINNTYSYKNKKNTSLTEKILNYIDNNIINSPVNLLKTELKVEQTKKETVSFIYNETTKPLIYIYNSHQGETYSREYLEEYNIVPDVLIASKMLKEKLENLKINTIVEESDILSYMKENNLNHAGSYKASKHFLSNAIKKYPTVKLFIDIHRDAATHKVSTTTINNKDCAKVLFIIGLENSNYKKNLSVVEQLNDIILSEYPSLTRGIMKKQGYGVNGVYNQDLSNNVILIEIGGNENNIEEVNNTLDILASVIGEYLNEKK